MDEYRLKITDMTKTFPGVKALDNVQLLVKPGTVHALIGENGAGKSTLMKCIFGIYKPDSGTIEIDGEKVEINDPHEALVKGISMIHQELNPIPYRNVSDNIWAGRFATKGIVIDETQMRQKTEELLRDLEFDIPANTLAKNLSVSQLQAVEIAKAVTYNSRIIIMDEPTSSLTMAETEHLFKIIRRLRDKGVSIIYISHKLEEVFEIADEISVMRDGKYIGKWETNEINMDGLIAQMVGRSMSERFPENEHVMTNETVLKVDNYTSADPHSFKNISFTLHKGEILGIGGLVGAQRTELVESIFGLRKIISGELELNGRKIKIVSPRDAIKHKFALLTEERRATGIIPMLSIVDNTLAAGYEELANNRFGYVDYKKMVPEVKKVCGELDVKTPSLQQQIKFLSGGNQQKVLFCRWLLMDCQIMILDEPTRGIDVAAKYEIYKIMRDLAKKGTSIIMVSSEMPELIGMSDNILVMCEGRLTGSLNGKEATQIEIMKYATSYSKKEGEETA